MVNAPTVSGGRRDRARRRNTAAADRLQFGYARSEPQDLKSHCRPCAPYRTRPRSRCRSHPRGIPITAASRPQHASDARGWNEFPPAEPRTNAASASAIEVSQRDPRLVRCAHRSPRTGAAAARRCEHRCTRRVAPAQHLLSHELQRKLRDCRADAGGPALRHRFSLHDRPLRTAGEPVRLPGPRRLPGGSELRGNARGASGCAGRPARGVRGPRTSP